MKALIAVLMLAAVGTFAAADPPDPGMHPDSGLFARFRLSMLYPRRPWAETRHAPAADPAGRLDVYLTDSDPVLKNLQALNAYLHEGLKLQALHMLGNPPPPEWTEAWPRLDRELEALKPLAAEGDAIKAGPVPAQRLFFQPKPPRLPVEGKAEFAGPEGDKLHEALTKTASAYNTRAELIEKSLAAGRAAETVERARTTHLP